MTDVQAADAAAVGAATATAYIGLGANLGDAAQTLRQALAALAGLPSVHLRQVASFYRTAPIDSSGPDYINTVARLDTELSPWALLDALQAIENQYGRTRPYRNAPRTLDLDILLYDRQRIDDARLTLPHPRMHERAFVLAPLLELAPGLRLAQGEAAQLLRGLAQAIEKLPA